VIPDWKTWQLSTRYRAWKGDFQAWHAWQNFDAWCLRVTASYWNHNGVRNLFSKKLLWIKTFLSVFEQLQCLVCSVALLEVWSRGKTWLKGSSGHCTGPTSQNSEKNLRIECDYGCSRLYFKTLINQKILQNTQKSNNLLKTKRILKMKYKLMGRPVYTCDLPGGAILPSSPVSYATACVTLKSHTCVWCVIVCRSEQYQKTYSYHYKVPFPSPGGLLWNNTPKKNFKSPQIEMTSTTNREFLPKFWMSTPCTDVKTLIEDFLTTLLQSSMEDRKKVSISS